MKCKIFVCIFVSALGFSKLKAQSDRVSPIVQIRGAMGFVVAQNLIVAKATAAMESGGMIEEIVMFSRLPGSRPPAQNQFCVTAKLTNVDRSKHLALLSVDTKGAIPILLAEYVDGEAVHRYMETKAPRTRMDLFHGARVIYASNASILEDSFRSVSGGPVINMRGEAVGMTIAGCDAATEWKACSVPVQVLRQFIASAASAGK